MPPAPLNETQVNILGGSYIYTPCQKIIMQKCENFTGQKILLDKNVLIGCVRYIHSTSMYIKYSFSTTY